MLKNMIGGTNMKITRSHVMGALAGISIAAVGYYCYKKNKVKVDEFLRSQGINVPECDGMDYEDMSIEALTETKEHIEDIIAEKTIDEPENIEVVVEEKK